jgi:hypothetical protein
MKMMENKQPASLINGENLVYCGPGFDLLGPILMRLGRLNEMGVGLGTARRSAQPGSGIVATANPL